MAESETMRALRAKIEWSLANAPSRGCALTEEEMRLLARGLETLGRPEFDVAVISQEESADLGSQEGA